VPRYFQEPPELFVRAASVVAPDVQVRVLRPGEALSLDGQGG
jgi:hypothetical protein